VTGTMGRLLRWMLVALCLLPSAALGAEGANDYVLGAEDVVQIAVWGNPELGVTVPIRPDGKISLPLGGDILAAGKTPEELRKAIAAELRRFIKEPSVSVVVMEINSPKIYLLGKRTGEGVLTLRSRITILQLLAQLGPVSGLDLARAYIIRGDRRLDVDLREVVESGDPKKNIELKGGDIVYIADAFSSRITVVGEVARPSNIPYRPGLTVVDALIEAGWVTEYANLKKVMVVREKNGGRETLFVNVARVTSGEGVQEDIYLFPGDMVVVKESLF